MSQLEILLTDITSLSVDAIVCPAHKFLSKGHGLSAQIFDQAGEELANACLPLANCAIGEARVTPGFQLPAHFIIHTVTPMWSGGDQWGSHELVQLKQCYNSVLQLALDNGIRSIALPALGAGSNRTPHPLSAHVGLEVMQQYLPKFERLIVCLHSDSAKHCWEEQYQAIHREKALLG